MAIAYDASSNGTNTGTGTLTVSHTCTGSDRILFVGVSAVVPNGVSVSDVTYAGVSMTRVSSELAIQTNVLLSLFYLVAPATGANDIVATVTGANGSTTKRLVAASYTGASQTGVPDASASTGPVTSSPFSQSVTTVADNCWVVASAYANDGISAGTGSTSRGISSTNQILADSNAAKTPAGSYSMGFTHTGADNCGIVMASFAPVSASGPTNLKSLDTNVKANIKSYNTNVIANVKSINTNA